MSTLKVSRYNQLFWFESLKLSEFEQYRYHVPPFQFKYEVKPDLKRLQRALQALVNLNYNLRSNFKEEEGEVKQEIHPHVVATLTEHTAETSEEYNQLLQEIINKPFNLTKEPLFRFALINDKTDHSSKLILVFHHIILDGTQLADLFSSLEKFYQENPDLSQTDQEQIEELNLYLKWEKEQLDKVDTKYWITKLKNYPWTINLPWMVTNGNSHDPKPSAHQLDDELFRRLKNFSQTNGYSVFNILKTVFSALISQYASQNKLVLTYSFNTRGKKFKNIKGAFLNTLFYCFNNKTSFIENLQIEQQEFTDSKRYANVIDILLALKPESGSFPVSLSVINLYAPRLESKAEIIFDYNMSLGSSDLLFVYYEFDDKLHCKFLTNKTFDPILKSRMFRHLSEALQKVLDNPNIPLNQIDNLESFEINTVLYQWNATEKSLSKYFSIIQWFENQVIATPLHTAATFNNKKITYLELNKQANQVANYFIKLGVNKGDRVAVCLERSITLNLVLLAIFKIGAVYVPIDTKYPELRIRSVLEDNQIQFFVTSKLFKTTSSALIDIEKNWGEIKLENDKNLQFSHKLNDLSYIIFTSGTTGKPKGILMEEKTLVNLITWASSNKSNIPKKIAQLANVGFDVFLQETFYCLLNGYELVIVPEQIKLSPLKFSEFIVNNLISEIFIPTALLEPLVQVLLVQNKRLVHLAKIIVAGEALKITKAIRKFFTENPSIKLENQYGPAETHVVCSYELSDNSAHWANNTPIGKPIANTKIYILDKNLKPVPLGIAGELYISGVGLARGYLNLKKLNQKRFIINPFITKDDNPYYSHMYNTGDLARWLPNGNLEYLGRTDDQVKIRGYRVELNEIENVLTLYTGISECIVLFKQDNSHKYLIAYYLASKTYNVSDLISHLNNYLPDYMIPGFFINLPKFPLTPNGKVDKAALPKPFVSDKEHFLAPRNELEEEICLLWQKILKVKHIGISDDFFRVGGDSILAMHLAYQMSLILNHYVSVNDIFKYRTILNILSQAFIADEKKLVIPNKLLEKRVLSFEQERLWFLAQFEGGSNAYHIPFILLLNENINLDLFKKSLKNIVDRHEILRTIFKENAKGEHYQCVLKHSLEIEQIFINSSLELSRILKLEINKDFDLTKEYPIRVFIFSLNNVHYALIIFHHIGFDGWSINLFFNELNGFYQSHLENKIYKTSVMPLQYKHFSAWERGYFSEKKLTKSTKFWHKKLAGYELLNFPIDKRRPLQFDYAGADVIFNLGDLLSDKLRKLAKRKETTLFSVLLTGLFILLQKYTLQNDLIIGIPITNRYRPQFENLIGFFVNSLAVRLDLEPQKNFLELIDITTKILIDAQMHKDLPFEKLVENLKIKKDFSRHPIFQTFFSLQHINITEQYFKFLSFEEYYHPAKFDLNLLMDDSYESIKGVFNYATSLFNKDTIERLVSHYQLLLEQLVEHDDTPIEKISILSPLEYQQIVFDWNANKYDFQPNECIHQLFEKQVEKTPDKIALIFGNLRLSYAELNQRANQWARIIQEIYKEKTGEDLKPNTIILLCVERSLDILVGILGILKAGGVYLPIDPSFPIERITYICDDSKAFIALTHTHLSYKLNHCNKDISFIYLDQNGTKNIKDTNLSNRNSIQDLAYIIYTSGTSGKPKGVLVTHANLVRLFSATNEYYGFNQNDVWTLFHSFIFDFSVWEMWGALFYGGKLVIPNELELHDFSNFHDFCKKHEVTILNQTPTAFYQFIHYAKSKPRLKSLRYIILGGEALSIKQLSPWWNEFGDKNPKLVNMYGITEVTVHVTLKELSKSDDSDKFLIGKPLADLKIYLLDEYRQVVPIGVIAEIYVSGPGVTKGYLNRTQLNNERFIPNPFSSDADQKDYGTLYKTGDLARWLANGELEYIGRNDLQVKVRGYRIELSEIENILAAYPYIQQAIVLIKEHIDEKGELIDTYLVAYYVAKVKLDEEAIFKYLIDKLPEYMLPRAILYIQKVPLTVHGKLDKAALPLTLAVDKEAEEVPKTEMEQQLCAIWSEVLNIPIESMGITHNFFKIGGDSILAIRLVAKINKIFNSLITVKDIFEFKSIAKLIPIIQSKIKHIKKINYIPFQLYNSKDYQINVLELNNIEDIYPASYFQTDMLIDSQRDPYIYHLIQSYMIRTKFDADKFQILWQQLIQKHALLRAGFILNKNGIWSVVIYKNINFNIQIRSEENLTDIILDELAKPFDFSIPGLFRIIIQDLGDKFNLILSSHHAIEDGWSVASLMNEFLLSYINNQVINHPLLLSYGEFVQNELNALKNEKHLQFWKTYLAHVKKPKINRKTEFIRSPTTVFTSSFHLKKDFVDLFNKIAKNLEISLDCVFILAYLKTIQFFQNQSEVTIGLLVNNRLEEEEGDRLFGLFLNMIPLRYNFEFAHKNNFREIFEKKQEILKSKDIPYSYIKKLLNNDFFDFGFNFVNFHVIAPSRNYIDAFSGYEKMSVPFMFYVYQKRDSSLLCWVTAHDDYANQEFVDTFTLHLKEILLSML